MDNTLNLWLGIIIISIIGTFAHFLYDISKENRILGLFTAVNESTWEHIKIALTPSLLWCLYDGYFYGEDPNYFCAKLISLLILVFFIPIVFYSYKKLTHKPVLVMDILTFYVAIILSQFSFYGTLELNPMSHLGTYFSCLGLFIFFGAYMTLTLAPIKNTIFKDPITGKYGFSAHRNFFKNLKKARANKRKNRTKK
ncbi:hypothetical protein IJH72_01765 [Candidatus Saccharibacteria bacterium]|nr:hypothetical protein [Candidatus Saccharibacteria bacterium]